MVLISFLDKVLKHRGGGATTLLEVAQQKIGGRAGRNGCLKTVAQFRKHYGVLAVAVSDKCHGAE